MTYDSTLCDLKQLSNPTSKYIKHQQTKTTYTYQRFTISLIKQIPSNTQNNPPA